jgi:hypothetical protein
MEKIRKAHRILVTNSSMEETTWYTYTDWGIKINLIKVIM